MSGRDPVVVAQRRLSPAQAATRGRLVDAAMALATEGGYASVGVREAAARAGLSVATGYQHFYSRDDILLEVYRVLLERGAARASGRAGADVRHVLVTEFRRIVRDVAAHPLLYRAVFAAQASAAGSGAGAAWDEPWTSWFYVLWNRADGADGALPDEACTLVLCVLTGALLHVVSGVLKPPAAVETFARAVDLALAGTPR